MALKTATIGSIWTLITLLVWRRSWQRSSNEFLQMYYCEGLDPPSLSTQLLLYWAITCKKNGMLYAPKTQTAIFTGLLQHMHVVAAWMLSVVASLFSLHTSWLLRTNAGQFVVLFESMVLDERQRMLRWLQRKTRTSTLALVQCLHIKVSRMLTKFVSVVVAMARSSKQMILLTTPVYSGTCLSNNLI